MTINESTVNVSNHNSTEDSEENYGGFNPNLNASLLDKKDNYPL